jgi:PAS domain S-box-containing protein
LEQALQDSQARLAGILESAMDAIITADDSQRILFFNKAAEDMFAYSAGEVIGKPVSLLIPDRFRDRHQEHIRRFGVTGVTNRTMGKLGTLYGLRANGLEFPIEASISQIQLAGGKLFTVILRDVTERVQAERELVESEQRFRATFEQAAVGIAHIDTEGKFLRVNRKICEILGYHREEMLTKTVQDVTYPQDLQADLDLKSQVLSGEIHTYKLEKRLIRKDSSITWVNLTSSLVREPTGEPKYLIRVIEDISLRREAEAALQAKNDEIKSMTQQLWQTAKLATMGELAASIAHELNNPLAILSLRTESLLQSISHASISDASIPEAAAERRDLMIMEQEIERMANLVANLLQFSRPGQRQVSTLNLTGEVDQTLDLIRNYLVNRHVTVLRDYQKDLPLIQADRQQLRQVFLNLFTNASDAMPDGGDLTIRIWSEEATRRIIIEVKDMGAGIPPDQIHQVMEPFFTTKTDGKGTGLGLAICRRIVEEHGGSLRISSPGRGLGTSVLIELSREHNGGQPYFED